MIYLLYNLKTYKMKLHYENKQLIELKGEVFKPFPFNEQYLVSNLGRVKSRQQIVKHNFGGKAIKKERILTQTDNGSGYLSVGFTENGKTKILRVSRLVALTFIPNTENKPQVNHINGIKHDNRLENLEWNTSGENVRHAWNNGLANKQASFLYIQKRLNEINPYITHRLRVKTPLGFGTIIIDQNCYRIEYDNGKFENLVKSLRFWQDDFKLVLRSFSELTKEIEVNGEKFVPIDWFEHDSVADYFDGNIWVNFLFEDCKCDDLDLIPYGLIQKLYEWHFDIHNLIPNNLAIDINTLNK